MKILHISDTHGYYPLDLPEADIVCHTGDYSFINKYSSKSKMVQELEKLNTYFGVLLNMYDVVIFCPGNHDFIFEQYEKEARDILSNATVLIDEQFDFGGYKFYGTPSQPPFFNWAFNHSDKERKIKYDNIPEGINILLTHCPPKDILDTVQRGSNKGMNVGCPILRDSIKERKDLKVSMFGHIHEQPVKIIVEDNVIYSNGCLVDDRYMLKVRGNVIEV
jgi:Icc-related predicted phosphoesterase